MEVLVVALSCLKENSVAETSRVMKEKQFRESMLVIHRQGATSTTALLSQLILLVLLVLLLVEYYELYEYYEYYEYH